jgi:YVTN family beta-propeller protein
MNKDGNYRHLLPSILYVAVIVSLAVPLVGFEKVFADEVIDTVIVGLSPVGVAYNEGNGYMYVTNAGSGTVSVIDGDTNTVVGTITVGNDPRGVAYNPGNGYMYVTNQHSNTVSVIDGDMVLDTVAVNRPVGVAYNPENGYMYVTSSFPGAVSIIDGETVVDTLPLMVDSVGIAYNEGNGYMYVTSPGLSTVSTIDGDILVSSVAVEAGPIEVAYNEGNGYMYVTHPGSNIVSIIDGTSVVGIINLAPSPVGVAYNEGNGYMYVTNGPSNIVSIIDGDTIIDTLTVGNNPQGVAYNEGNGYMYVTNFGSNSISVISTGATPEVQPPTATTITSSVDGNENQVQNKSSTVSPSITFEVTATQGTNPIAGFECSLDDSPFSNCATSNPATIEYDNLVVDREHVFKVRAVDTQGNTDAKPAVFVWTVLTAEQALDKLIDNIDEMGLSKGTTTSLQAPLNAALKQLENGKEAEACGPLDAFLDQVNEKEGNGQLTPQQAAELRQQTTAIQNEIGCTSSTSTASTSEESNSPIESLIDSTLSNMDSIQSKQAGKALDKIQKDTGLYKDFFDTK